MLREFTRANSNHELVRKLTNIERLNRLFFSTYDRARAIFRAVDDDNGLLLVNRGVIAGGFPSSLITGKAYGDIDIFVPVQLPQDIEALPTASRIMLRDAAVMAFQTAFSSPVVGRQGQYISTPLKILHTIQGRCNILNETINIIFYDHRRTVETLTSLGLLDHRQEDRPSPTATVLATFDINMCKAALIGNHAVTTTAEFEAGYENRLLVHSSRGLLTQEGISDQERDRLEQSMIQRKNKYTERFTDYEAEWRLE